MLRGGGGGHVYVRVALLRGDVEHRGAVLQVGLYAWAPVRELI